MVIMKKSIIKSIVSGDSLVSKRNINFFPNLENKIVGIDMELVAIAQICQKNKIDVFSFKFVSDCVLAHKQHSTYLTSLKELQKITILLIKFLYSND